VTPERWKQVEAAFEQALDLATSERTAFLEKTCNSDEELRRVVESLLESHASAGDFIDEPSLLISSEDLRDDAEHVPAGQLIGAYRIISDVGRGGMGAVYLAERADEQYKKQVAIKLIKRGMDTDSVLRHFRNERQILASFDHTNIARLFDGGTTKDGLPYFVMEYVEGVPIDQYCNAHQLSINDRLKLFREVCAAVSYAHRHTVIHRDIKPSNILVTNEGLPKLLDFGIAKILTAGENAEALMTVTGMRPMTPEYASPEQVHCEPVTTASDVYSLGVVLYELLTGTSPYRLTSRAPSDIERAITEEEPTRPSTVITEKDPHSPIRNPKLLKGDLDNIVLMALRKEPARRYQSAEQLSEDIRRHLENRPVLARKDTMGYRASKFLRRNKLAAAAALLILVSLVVGLIATTWQAHRATVQKARAERRFNDVRQLAHSVLFDYHDAIKNLPGATRVRERLVKDALTYLDSLTTEASGDSALQRELAAAYERVGDVRGEAFGASLGDRAGATDSYKKALLIREALVAAAPHDMQNRRDLAASYRKIGDQFLDTTDAASGIEYLRKSLSIYSEIAMEQPARVDLRRDLAEAYTAFGNGLDSRGDESVVLEQYGKALPIYQELLQDNPKDRAIRRSLSVVYEKMGNALFLRSDTKGALERNEKAVALREALLAEDPTNADYRRMVAISYQNNGDYRAWVKDIAGALESFRKKLALDEKSVAADPANAQTVGDLGYSLVRIGELLAGSDDYAQAMGYLTRAAEAAPSPICRWPSRSRRRWSATATCRWCKPMKCSSARCSRT
jgi:non-specific serine/threonine protein kinase/serine/threonine-protein kinase